MALALASAASRRQGTVFPRIIRTPIVHRSLALGVRSHGLLVGVAGAWIAIAGAGAGIHPLPAEAVRVDEEMNAYGATSGPVKYLVQGLTDLSNAVGTSGDFGSPNLIDAAPARDISPQKLRDTIERDFVDRNYLWTGRLTSTAYTPDCSFTDPTLSFVGVSTFERNLANLRPVIKALVDSPKTNLFSCRLEEDSQRIVAEWEMDGRINLPWRPRLKLRGQTIFSYEPSRAGRVVAYDESWAATPSEALLQLFKPAVRLAT